MAEPFRILLASVLKPIDDARMAHKLGRSLLKIPGAEIHIAGFKPAYKTEIEGLTLHPIFNFSRLSLERAAAGFQFLKLVLKLKPELLIIGTHELLPYALVAKLRLNCLVIYDLRENYYRNIRYTTAFPVWLRIPLAALVRGLEKAEYPFIDHYLLAEKAYSQELSFLKSNFTVIENKTIFISPANEVTPKVPSNRIRLLYSGTISETYGVFEAIKLTTQLNNINPTVSLSIIGYAPQAEILSRVQEAVKDKPFIRIIGGENHVPHAEIMKEISHSDFGLISYRPNPSTINCIPTKLYEYLAIGLPVISQQHPVWSELLNKHRGGISIDFEHPNPSEILAKLESTQFYPDGPVKEATWASEEGKLLSVITKLITERK